MKGHSRNLKKDALGGVIFGCKSHTMSECLKENLFGLPASHQSYVKNVTPGLPLFLFNYSNRMLHGIFVAVTHGQININSNAWIGSEGGDITPYAAQVRVSVRWKCRPLPEQVFKPLIADNYYAERHFWFELDNEQTNRLTKLFLSSSFHGRIPWQRNAASQKLGINAMSRGPLREENIELNDKMELDSRTHDKMSVNQEHSYASALFNKRTSGPETNCVTFHKTASPSPSPSSSSSSSSSCEKRSGEGCEAHKKRINSSMSDHSGLDCDSCATSSNDMVKLLPDTFPDCWEELVDTCDEVRDADSEVRNVNINEAASAQDHERNYDMPDLTDVSQSEDMMFFECIIAKESAEAVLDTELESTNEHILGGEHMDMQFPDLGSAVTKLMQEIEDLKFHDWKQRVKVEALEHHLLNSNMEIIELKKRCGDLESLHPSGGEHIKEGNFKPLGNSVFVVGGSNGSSWLQDLDSYSPYEDKVVSLCSMTFPRSYASAASLNGELYLFGGMHDGIWYDIVESYNPSSNQWVQRPCLNKKKGSVAGASVNQTIFAIGGGNGGNCFSEVEMFDLNIGRWFSTPSMLEERFGACATDLNGVIYVSGGYDGKNYMRSMERFDPRESSWTKIRSMNTERGGHSLVTLKEKLYALGGYDGKSMIPTVEIFDPRVGSWMTAEPMKLSRGYFGSFVLDDKLYVIGGLDEKEQVLDGVECYVEGYGWQRKAQSAIGKRSFLSTILL